MLSVIMILWGRMECLMKYVAIVGILVGAIILTLIISKCVVINGFFSTNFVIFYQKNCNFNVNSTNFADVLEKQISISKIC